MAYQLVMQTGPTPGRTFSLESSEISIGREIGSGVFINEAEVSRRHARLTIQAGTYLLEDLGSTNGTFVNGQRLMGPRLLQPGDTILVGEKTSLTFEVAPFDPNAAPISIPEQPIETEPELTSPPEPLPVPEPVYVPPPVEAFSSPTPPPQFTPYAEPEYSSPPQPSFVEPVLPEETRPSRRWLWAGCGCLVVLLCVLAGAAYAFDYLNLYCTPPFRDVMVIFGAACP